MKLNLFILAIGIFGVIQTNCLPQNHPEAQENKNHEKHSKEAEESSTVQSESPLPLEPDQTHLPEESTVQPNEHHQSSGEKEHLERHGHRYHKDYAAFVKEHNLGQEHDRLTKEDIERRERRFLQYAESFAIHNHISSNHEVGFTPLSDRDPSNVIAERCKLIKPAETRALPVFVKPPPITINATLNYSKFAQPVRDQGNCGSCWAFATVAMIETRSKLANLAFNTPLSEQYLVSCDSYDGGCDGGWPTNTLQWIMGVSSNVAKLANYAYTTTSSVYGQSGTCNAFAPKIASNISAYKSFNVNGNVTQAKILLNQYGPMVSAMAAPADPTFSNYKSGVYTGTCAYGTSCTTPNTLNHAVVLMGYNVDPTTKKEYWLVRNSWSTLWGERGYFKILIDANNQCCIITTLFAIEYNK